jgi:hypothetical protein
MRGMTRCSFLRPTLQLRKMWGRTNKNQANNSYWKRWADVHKWDKNTSREHTYMARARRKWLKWMIQEPGRNLLSKVIARWLSKYHTQPLPAVKRYSFHIQHSTNTCQWHTVMHSITFLAFECRFCDRNHPLTEVALFRVFRTRFSCKAYERIGILRQKQD